MSHQKYKTIEEALQMSVVINNFQTAYLNLLHTGNLFEVAIHKALKEFGITGSQYNVLRILRGQKGHPIPTVEIQNRMIYKKSNVSRILVKLLDKGLIESKACPENRRRNNVTITQKGLTTLAKTDNIPFSIFNKMEQVISNREAKALNDILNKLRQADLNDLGKK